MKHLKSPNSFINESVIDTHPHYSHPEDDLKKVLEYIQMTLKFEQDSVEYFEEFDTEKLSLEDQTAYLNSKAIVSKLEVIEAFTKMILLKREK